MSNGVQSAPLRNMEINIKKIKTKGVDPNER